MGKIRIAREEDAQEIIEIYRYYITDSVVSFEVEVPSVDEMKARIRHSLERYAWLVWEADGKVRGYAYAARHRERAAYLWAVDASIYIGKDWQGKGVGKALYRALFSILKLQGYQNVYACICLPNPGSEGIHESFGFQKNAHFHQVGYKFGAWWDIGWWELFLQDKSASPFEPVSLDRLDKEAVASILVQGEERSR